MKSCYRSAMIGGLACAGVALIASAFIPAANADTWNKKTIVKVDQPIIAGNKVLDPGTYVWKLLDSPADRHIVQIFDKNEQHLETTVLSIPDYNAKIPEKAGFDFWETPPGVPKAVRTWYYPGARYAEDLPYPKKLIAQLASAAPAAVPMNYNEPAPEPAPAPAPQPEAQPAPEPAPTAAPEPAPTPAPVPAPAPAPQALPHTASFNPLIGLLGVLSLGLAGVLTLATKKA